MKGCGNPYGWCKHREPDKLGEWDACYKCHHARYERIKDHPKECPCYDCNPSEWSENMGKH